MLLYFLIRIILFEQI